MQSFVAQPGIGEVRFDPAPERSRLSDPEETAPVSGQGQDKDLFEGEIVIGVPSSPAAGVPDVPPVGGQATCSGALRVCSKEIINAKFA